MHLDVSASRPAESREAGWQQVQAHVRTLTQAGATVVREVDEVTGRCVVLQDPEGNEFCVH